jgi:glycosyltransferase involved in cell wall biosynthesis
MQIALINNIVAPYVHRVLERIEALEPRMLHVISCAATEPGRLWRSETPSYRHEVLPGYHLHLGLNRNVYFNPGIWSVLARGRPDAVFVAGFFPTMLAAAAHASLNGLGLGVMLDSGLDDDIGRRSRVHRWLRKAVIGRAAAGIGASSKSAALLVHYGLTTENVFVAPLVPAWDPPLEPTPFDDRRYDLLWCGSINDAHKGVRFFADVVAALARERVLKVRIVGEGPDRRWLEGTLARLPVETRFDGFLQASALAEAYDSARVLLFPTRMDAWGLVANEAAQCGTPTIVSPHAGAAGELIVDGQSGFVVPLELDAWCRRVSQLLSDPTRWARMSVAARAATANRTVSASADAMIAAFRRAADARRR